MRVVRRWESEGLFTLKSITSIIYVLYQNNAMVNGYSLSQFITIITLEDSNLFSFMFQ